MAASRRAVEMISQTLRVKELKRLSLLCGLATTGPKNELIARLTAAVNNNTTPPSNPDPKPVVLSIDLGIKNLAFSLLTPAPVISSKPSAKLKKHIKAGLQPSSFFSGPPTVKLYAWHRLSLLGGPSSLFVQNVDESVLDVTEPATVFSPAALAETANAFLKEFVLKLNPLPTYILIERQRWRSGSAAAIQEWTVRVNTLEAMLHASLRTMRDVGVWDGEVVSVRSERVGQFFLDGTELGKEAAPETDIEAETDAKGKSTKGSRTGRKKSSEPETDIEAETDSKGKSTKGSRTGRTKSTELKKLKIELLNRWLGEGDHIVQPGSPEAGHIIEGYKHALNNKKRGRSKRVVDEGNGAEEGPPTLGKKLDDFTDSLLQGMAWLRWQENTVLLQTESGIEQLLK